MSPIQKISRSREKKLTISHVQELKGAMVQDLEAADFQDALDYKERNMLRGENLYPLPLGVDTKEFGRFGIGLRLFFEFLKLSAILFLVMGIISLPAIYSNFTGDGLLTNYQTYSQSYATLTLANQPDLKLLQPQKNASQGQKDDIKAKNKVRIDDFVEKMKGKNWWVIIPDMAYTSVFVLFIFYWKRRSKQIKRETIAAQANPSHYTLYVYGFSKKITDNVYLKGHFSAFGHIQEVSIVRNYFGTLYQHKQAADLIKQITTEQKRLEMQGKSDSKLVSKLQEELSKVNSELSKISKQKMGSVVSYDKYPSLGAYIVFSKIEDKIACIEAYNKSRSFCGKKDARCYFEGKLLKIREEIEEPSNIKWENLDMGRQERFRRSVVVYILILAVMFITFIAIFVADLVNPSSTTNCGSKIISFQDAKEKNDKIFTKCFCKQQSLTTLKDNNEIQSFCWDYYVTYIWLTVFSFIIGVIVMIVNYILEKLLEALTIYCKYHSITKETLGNSITLFISMFINTALITLLLQADIFGWKPAVTITSPIPPLQDLQEEKGIEFSPDFDRQWYTDVGSKITLAMLVNIFYPHIAVWMLTPCKRRNRLRKAKKALIQSDMNQYIVGPSFEISSHCASVLNTIFVTLFYSPGIPILLWFASLSLTFQYWVYKYYVLRFNKKPPTYDRKLNKRMIQLLPLAAIFHLMIAIYMYGSPLIFPYSADQISSSVNLDMVIPNADNSLKTIIDRIQNQIFLFVLLIGTIGLLIIDRFLRVFFKRVYRFLFCIKKQNKLSQVQSNGKENIKTSKMHFGSYQEEYFDMKSRMLTSYDIRLNEQYSSLIRAIELGKDDHEKQLSQRLGGKVKQESNVALQDPENPGFLKPDIIAHQRRKSQQNNSTKRSSHTERGGSSKSNYRLSKQSE